MSKRASERERERLRGGGGAGGEELPPDTAEAALAANRRLARPGLQLRFQPNNGTLKCICYATLASASSRYLH